MASNNAKQERIRELVAALLAEEAAEASADRLETMDEIEEGMIRVSDLVGYEFGEQKLARHSARPPMHPRCPDCGQEGKVVGAQERELLTRRGQAAPSTSAFNNICARRTFWLDPFNFRTTACNSARSSSVKRTIYFLSMGNLRVSERFPISRLLANPKNWL